MVEDTPDDLVYELHNEQMWGAHPYGYNILGTRETVKALGVRELRELHDRVYHPGQMVVAASGNVRHEALLDALERTGWLGVESRPGSSPPPPVPVMLAPERRHIDREGAQTHVV